MVAETIMQLMGSIFRVIVTLDDWAELLNSPVLAELADVFAAAWRFLSLVLARVMGLA